MGVQVVQVHRLYRVSDQALRQAREIGIGGAVVKRLQRMGMRSAPYTHPDGNRRFDDFVLSVQGKEIVGVNRI